MQIFLTKPIITFCVATMVLSACSSGGVFSKFGKNNASKDHNSTTIIPESEKPKLRNEVVAKPQNLGRITVADASKVSSTELKAAAAKSAEREEEKLGQTIVSLGLLDQAGFWLETPLVSSETDGRVVNEATGKSANVRLIPNGAIVGGGSQMSIATMQLLGIAITDLAEVQVFTR